MNTEISSAELSAWFSPEQGVSLGNISVPLRRLLNAKVLWINEREMRLDAAYSPQAGRAGFAKHLLHRCAVQIASNSEARPGLTGVADRYGGRGISANGGAGRAAFVNGYYLKGVGCTPLLGAGADPVHSTGTMELAECLREVVCSEVVAQEFPHGAVPVLAVIDTGLTQKRLQEAGISTNTSTHISQRIDALQNETRLCILVRPAFLRPAHFDRALLFQSPALYEGERDAQRVGQMLRSARGLWGQAGLRQGFESLWLRWASQIAYGWIARLPQGGCSPSNITWDGRLLDFGAMSALPSWAKTSTVHGAPLVGAELPMAIDCLGLIAQQMGRFDADLSYSPEQLGLLQAQTLRHFQEQRSLSMLRILGLSRIQAQGVLACAKGGQIVTELGRVLAHFEAEYFDTYEATPQPRIAWALDHFWQQPQTGACERLRDILKSLLCPPHLGEKPCALVMKTLIASNGWRAKTRTELFRENIRAALNDAVLFAEKTYQLQGGNTQEFASLIERALDTLIVASRRNSFNEPHAASLLAFERTDGLNFSRFGCELTGKEFLLLDEPNESKLRISRGRLFE